MAMASLALGVWDRDDDLPLGVVSEHVGDCTRCILEGVGLVDNDPDAGTEKGGERVKPLSGHFEFTYRTSVEPFPVTAACPILGRLANNLPVLPTLLGMKIPPGARTRPVLVGRMVHDVVNDDVIPFRPLREVARCVVDDMVRAERPDELDVLRAAHARHFRTERDRRKRRRTTSRPRVPIS